MSNPIEAFEQFDCITGDKLHRTKRVIVTGPDGSVKLGYNATTLMRIAEEKGQYVNPPHFREPMSTEVKARLASVLGVDALPELAPRRPPTFDPNLYGELDGADATAAAAAAAAVADTRDVQVHAGHGMREHVRETIGTLNGKNLYACPFCFDCAERRFLLGGSTVEPRAVVLHEDSDDADGNDQSGQTPANRIAVVDEDDDDELDVLLASVSPTHKKGNAMPPPPATPSAAGVQGNMTSLFDEDGEDKDDSKANKDGTAAGESGSDDGDEDADAPAADTNAAAASEWHVTPEGLQAITDQRADPLDVIDSLGADFKRFVVFENAYLLKAHIKKFHSSTSSQAYGAGLLFDPSEGTEDTRVRHMVHRFISSKNQFYFAAQRFHRRQSTTSTYWHNETYFNVMRYNNLVTELADLPRAEVLADSAFTEKQLIEALGEDWVDDDDSGDSDNDSFVASTSSSGDGSSSSTSSSSGSDSSSDSSEGSVASGKVMTRAQRRKLEARKEQKTSASSGAKTKSSSAKKTSKTKEANRKSSKSAKKGTKQSSKTKKPAQKLHGGRKSNLAEIVSDSFDESDDDEDGTSKRHGKKSKSAGSKTKKSDKSKKDRKKRARSDDDDDEENDDENDEEESSGAESEDLITAAYLEHLEREVQREKKRTKKKNRGVGMKACPDEDYYEDDEEEEDDIEQQRRQRHQHKKTTSSAKAPTASKPAPMVLLDDSDDEAAAKAKVKAVPAATMLVDDDDDDDVLLGITTSQPPPPAAAPSKTGSLKSQMQKRDSALLFDDDEDDVPRKVSPRKTAKVALPDNLTLDEVKAMRRAKKEKDHPHASSSHASKRKHTEDQSPSKGRSQKSTKDKRSPDSGKKGKKKERLRHWSDDDGEDEDGNLLLADSDYDSDAAVSSSSASAAGSDSSSASSSDDDDDDLTGHSNDSDDDESDERRKSKKHRKSKKRSAFGGGVREINRLTEHERRVLDRTAHRDNEYLERESKARIRDVSMVDFERVNQTSLDEYFPLQSGSASAGASGGGGGGGGASSSKRRDKKGERTRKASTKNDLSESDSDATSSSDSSSDSSDDEEDAGRLSFEERLKRMSRKEREEIYESVRRVQQERDADAKAKRKAEGKSTKTTTTTTTTTTTKGTEKAKQASVHPERKAERPSEVQRSNFAPVPEVPVMKDWAQTLAIMAARPHHASSPAAAKRPPGKLVTKAPPAALATSAKTGAAAATPPKAVPHQVPQPHTSAASKVPPSQPSGSSRKAPPAATAPAKALPMKATPDAAAAAAQAFIARFQRPSNTAAAAVSNNNSATASSVGRSAEAISRALAHGAPPAATTADDDLITGLDLSRGRVIEAEITHHSSRDLERARRMQVEDRTLVTSIGGRLVLVPPKKKENTAPASTPAAAPSAAAPASMAGRKVPMTPGQRQKRSRSPPEVIE